MEIKKITTNDWLNLVNAEAHPDLTSFQVINVELGGKFAVCLVTGYGIFRSPLMDSKESLTEEEAKLVIKYDEAKSHGSMYEPKFNSITTF